MELQHNLVLKGRKFILSLNYQNNIQLLSQVKPEIGMKLMNKENYQVQSDVSSEIFQNFIE